MSLNLIELVNHEIRGQVTEVLGKILGGSESQNDLAISSAIPGIFSVMMNSKSDKSDTDSLFNAISAHNDSVLDNLSDLLTFKNHNSLNEMGSKVLTEVIGESGVDNLTSAVSVYSGSDEGNTKTVVACLASIIFAVVKRNIFNKKPDLEPNTIINEFYAQKDHVELAMPFGFSDELESANKEKSQDLIIEKDQRKEKKVIHKTRKKTKESQSVLAILLPLAMIIGALLLAYDTFFKERKSNSKPSNAIIMDNLNLDRSDKELTEQLKNSHYKNRLLN